MARFTTYVTILALVAMAATCPVSATLDPNDVAAAANDEAAEELKDIDGNTKEEINPHAINNTAAAIADSISNVTVDKEIDPPDADDAPATPPASSATIPIVSSIAVATVVAFTITGLFV